MRSFVKTRSLHNGEITLSITDIGKSCPSREFKRGKYVFLTPFAKTKFRENFRIYSMPLIDMVET